MDTSKKLVIFTLCKSAYGPKRFCEEAGKMGLESFALNYHSLNFEMSKDLVLAGTRDLHLPDSNYVILREPGHNGAHTPQRDFLLNFYIEKGSRILNKDSFLRWSVLDKLTQAFELQKAKLPFVESRNFGSKKKIIKSINSFPVILKERSGSRGEKVFKIDSSRDLASFINQETTIASNLIVQPFLLGGEDLRVIVVGSRAIGAMKRTARAGEYLTNYSAGGRVEVYDLGGDETAKDLSEKAAKLFLCEYAGVDLIKGKDGEWEILEVNRSCQFTGFEKATGINVAKETIKLLLI